MTTSRILIAAALAAFSAAAPGGKTGTVGATLTPSDALSRAANGNRDLPDVAGLYQRLRGLPETIVLENGTVVSPELTTSDGTVFTLTVAADGTILSVDVVTPGGDQPPATFSCSA